MTEIFLEIHRWKNLHPWIKIFGPKFTVLLKFTHPEVSQWRHVFKLLHLLWCGRSGRGTWHKLSTVLQCVWLLLRQKHLLGQVLRLCPLRPAQPNAELRSIPVDSNSLLKNHSRGRHTRFRFVLACPRSRPYVPFFKSHCRKWQVRLRRLVRVHPVFSSFGLVWCEFGIVPTTEGFHFFVLPSISKGQWRKLACCLKRWNPWW